MYNGTPYEEIYKIFLRKITDYNLMSLEEEFIEQRLEGYLESAIANFPECKDLEERDNDLKRFKCNLSLIVKEALSHLMLVEWVRPVVNNITDMKQFLGDSEYKTFSQANHLNTLIELEKHCYDEADRLKKSHSHQNFDYSQLR